MFMTFLSHYLLTVVHAGDEPCIEDFECDVDDIVVECAQGALWFPTSARYTTATGYDFMQWSSDHPTVQFSDLMSPALTLGSLVFPSAQCKTNFGITATFSISGEVGSCSAAVVGADSTPPEWLTPDSELPQNTSANCDDIPLPAVLTAVDACAGALTVDYTETTVGSTITRVWSADDGCATNEGLSHTQIITVIDGAAPELVGEFEDYSVECDAVSEPCDAAAFDNCDDNLAINFTDWINDGTCTDDYTIFRHWRVTDSAGHSTDEYQKVTVSDTTPPTLVDDHFVSYNISCEAGVPFPTHAAPSFVDNCDTDVDVTTTTYNFSDTEESDPCHTTQRFDATATDNCGNTATHSFTVIQIDDELPYSLNGAPEDYTAECGDDLDWYCVSWTDKCDPTGVSESNTTVEVLHHSSGDCEDKNVTTTWTATDSCGQTQTLSQSITVKDTTPPTFDSTPSAELTVECSHIPEYNLTATDVCDGEVDVIFSETTVMEPGATNLKNITRYWVATDNCGNTVDYEQFIKVIDEDAPVLLGVSGGESSMECDPANNTIPPSTVTADDNCPCDCVSVEVTDVTDDSDICNVTTVRSWSATDCDGLTTTSSVSHTYRIVDTTPPTFTCPSDQTVYVGGPVKNISAFVFEEYKSILDFGEFDACTNASVTVSMSEENDGCEANVTRVFSAVVTDECGLTDECEWTIIYRDIEAPEFTSSLGAETVPCKNFTGVNLPDPAATDNYFSSEELTVVYSEAEYSGNDCDFTYSVTFDVSDPCGHEGTSMDWSVRVTDSEIPVWDATPANTPHGTKEWCEEYVVSTMWHEFDGSDDCTNATVTTSSSNDGAFCLHETTYTHTSRLADDCGKSAVDQTQTIIFEDTTNPRFEDLSLEDVFVECADNFTVVDLIPTVRAWDWDPCTDDFVQGEDELEVTYSMVAMTDSQLETHGLCEGYIVTFSTVDCSDNPATLPVNIGWYDNDLPSFTDVPENTTIDCYNLVENATWSMVNYTDNCHQDNDPTMRDSATLESYVTIGNDDYNNNNDPHGITQYQFTWKITDDCGNYEIHIQTVDVDDQTPPVFDDVLDINVTCNETGWDNLSGPDATDNCEVDYLTYSRINSTVPICGAELVRYEVFYVEDHNGNQDSITRTIRVSDPFGISIDPYDPWGLGDGVLEHNVTCNATVVPTSPNVSYPCGDPSEVTKTEVVTSTRTGNDDFDYTISVTTEFTHACDEVETTTELHFYDPFKPNVRGTDNFTQPEFCQVFSGLVFILADEDGENMLELQEDKLRELTFGSSDETHIVDDLPCGTNDVNFTVDALYCIEGEDGTYYNEFTFTTEACKSNDPEECDSESTITRAEFPELSWGLSDSVDDDECDDAAECASMYTNLKSLAQFETDVRSNADPSLSCLSLNITCFEDEDDSDCLYVKNMTCIVDHPCIGEIEIHHDASIYDATPVTPPVCEDEDHECPHVVDENEWVLDEYDCSDNQTGTWSAPCRSTYSNPNWQCFRDMNDTKYLVVNDTAPPTVNVYGSESQECTEEPNWNYTYGDNCTDMGELISTTTKSNTSIVGGHWFEVEISATVTDACGFTATDSHTIVFNDTTPPELHVPADAVYEAEHDRHYYLNYTDGLFTSLNFYYSDPCGPVDAVYPYEIKDETCKYNYTITYYPEAANDLGLVNTTVVEHKVEDTKPPVFGYVPPLYTGNCIIGLNDTSAMADLINWAITASDVASGDLTNNITSESGYVSRHEENFTFAVNWTVVDDCGHDAFYEASLYCEELDINRTVYCPDDISYNCADEETYFNNCLSDPEACYADLILSNSILPETDYVVVNVTTVTVNDTDCEASQEYFNVSVVVYTDEDEYVGECSFLVGFFDTEAPVVANPPAPSVEYYCNPETEDLDVTDNCHDGLLVDYTETDTYLVGDWDYQYTRTWVVSDHCTASQTFNQIVTVKDDRDPYFVLPLIGNDTENCSYPSIPTAEAEDNCTEVTVTSAYTDDDDCVYHGVRTVTYTATDEEGNTAEHVITLEKRDETAPTALTNPTNQTYERDLALGCGIPQETIIGLDDCDLAPITATEVVADPDFDSIPLPLPYSWTRVWSLCDTCGNCHNVTQDITLIDTTPPTISITLPNSTVECSDAGIESSYTHDYITVSVDDECWGCVGDVCELHHEQTVTEDCVAGGEYVQETIITVTDQNGLNTTADQAHRYEVEDSTYPEWLTDPYHNATGGCGSVWVINFTEPTGADICSNATVVVEKQSVDGFADSCFTQFEHNYTLIDDCGNENPVSKSESGYYEDITGPEVPAASNVTSTCHFDEIGLPDDDTYFWQNYSDSIIDDCQGILFEKTCQFVENDDDCETTIECSYYDIYDDCGNPGDSFNVSQTWVDHEAPKFVNVPEDFAHYECYNFSGFDDFTATDNCDAGGAGPEGTYAVTVVAGELEYVEDPRDIFDSVTHSSSFQIGYYEQNFTATDHCGNENTVMLTARIVDTTPPFFTSKYNDTAEDCNITGVEGTQSYDDNCTDVTVTETTTCFSSCEHEGVCNTTVTITDEGGNTDSYTYSQQYEDSENPVLFWEDDGNQVYYNCTAPSRGAPNVTDNCDVSIEAFSTLSTCEFVSVTTWHHDIIPENVTEDVNYYHICNYSYEAHDECGNIGYADTYDVALDLEAPELTGYPDNLTLACDESVPVGWSSGIDASDNCCTHTQHTVQTILGDCPEDYAIEYTVTVNDDNDNVATAAYRVEFNDTVAPVLTNPFSFNSTNISCSDVYEVETPLFLDNCAEAADVNYTVVSAANPDLAQTNYTNCTDYRIDWVDECGNNDSISFTVCTIDEECPVLVGVPADMTVECDQPMPAAPVVTYTDDCYDGPMDSTETTSDGSCVDQYDMVRTWTVDDGLCVESQTQTISVVDTTKPTFDIDDSYTIECDEPFVDIEISNEFDNCDSGITEEDRLDLSTARTGATNTTYSVTYTFTLTDRCGNVESKESTVNVQDTTDPVLSDEPANQTVECHEVPLVYPGMITATDNCANVTAQFDETIVQGDCPCNYTIVREWYAEDYDGNDVQHTQYIYVQDTTAPVIFGVPNDTVVESDYIPAPPALNDPNGVYATDLSSDGSYEYLTVVYEGEVVSCGACNSPDTTEFTITRTWSVTDDCDHVSTEVQIIIVVDTTPPTPNEHPENVTVDCDTIPPPCTLFGVNEHDHYVWGIPESIDAVFTDSIIPTETGWIIKRVWVLTDLAGNTFSIEQFVTVIDDIAPVFSRLPQDETVECDCDTFPEAPVLTAVDNCDDEVTVNFTETSDRTDPSKNTYTLTRTWSATDSVGSESTHVQVITVYDTEAPSFTLSPASIDVHCDHLPMIAADTAVFARDSCDANVTLTFVDSSEPSSKNCAHDYVLTRVFTATDADDNTASHTQVISVYDNVAPVPTGGLTETCVVFDEDAAHDADMVFLPVIEVEDNCDMIPEVNFLSCNSTSTTPNNCQFAAGSLVVSREMGAHYDAYFSLTDECGNSRVVRQRVFYPSYATAEVCPSVVVPFPLNPPSNPNPPNAAP